MNKPIINFVMDPMIHEDLPLISENEKKSHTHPWSENNFKDSISSGYWAYVLKLKNSDGNKSDNSDIIGHCIFMPGVDEIHLLNITVLPSFRRNQIASRVLRTIEPLALKAGLNKVLLEVRVSNHPAISVYQGCGYKEIARRKNYYRAGLDPTGKLLHEDAIIMVKELN